MKAKISVKDEKCNSMKPGTKPSEDFSWPSLWKNGPRRSAFQPYKVSFGFIMGICLEVVNK